MLKVANYSTLTSLNSMRGAGTLIQRVNLAICAGEHHRSDILVPDMSQWRVHSANALVSPSGLGINEIIMQMLSVERKLQIAKGFDDEATWAEKITKARTLIVHDARVYMNNHDIWYLNALQALGQERVTANQLWENVQAYVQPYKEAKV